MAKPAFVVNGTPSNEEKSYAALAHIGSLIGMFFCPLNFIIPAAMMFFTESEYVKEHACEALNFQISSMIVIIVSALACVVLVGIPFLIAAICMSLICPIIAAVRAKGGNGYRYPWTFRLI